DIYRGDSFQVIIPNIEDVVKSALLLRLALKSEDSSFDARMSIGIGQSDNVRRDVRSSTGEAYTLSGIGLDKLKLNTFAIYTNKPEFQKSIELLTKYLDSNITELTQVQSRALYEYLIANDKSHLSVANTLGKSRVNTTQILNKAKYQLVEDYIEMFNELVSEHFNG
ncbi:hypothetical protein, partial [Shewanella sp. GutDb-MelDb]|uniref:hypothetical protein n=1 Tax=Shewanella sp. GutDb-MelDb TaxID=2058316 RepID=UPI000C7ACE41